MIWRDKENNEIKDGNALLFTLEDKVEKTGFNKFVTDVQLCFWSENEKRYIPFSEQYDHNFIKESEIVKNQVNQKL